ncbi:MAG: ArsR/SmtB family transcription factor [Planctomycetota bacterium]
MLKLLGDPTRLRLLGLLQAGERNVSNLCEALGLAQPTVSHHLGLMRQAGLLGTRRVGKQVFYSHNPDAIRQPDDSSETLIRAGTVEIRLARLDARAKGLTPVIETKPRQELTAMACAG